MTLTSSANQSRSAPGRRPWSPFSIRLEFACLVHTSLNEHSHHHPNLTVLWRKKLLHWLKSTYYQKNIAKNYVTTPPVCQRISDEWQCLTSLMWLLFCRYVDIHLQWHINLWALLFNVMAHRAVPGKRDPCCSASSSPHSSYFDFSFCSGSNIGLPGVISQTNSTETKRPRTS